VLKEIAFHIMERDTYNFIDNRFQWYHYISDIIDTKLLKISSPEVKRKAAPKNVVTIRFVNKGIDDIHLSKIFRSSEVTSLLPEELQAEDDIPSVTINSLLPFVAKF
jgi:hypothetical protein